MSILIKGMEMPKNCLECELKALGALLDEYYCPITKVDCLSIGRQDDCPLEEVQETHDKRTETHACDLISRKDAIDALKRAEALTRAFGYHNVIETIRELPSAQPDIPPYVTEIEAEYKKAVNMPYINKPLAKALYEVWKKHDREEASRNG